MPKRLKVTVIAPDSMRPVLSRTYIIARALMLRYDVEVIRTVTPVENHPYPIQMYDFPCPYHLVTNRPLPAFRQTAREVLDKITGDVIYAIKPVPTSYGLALWAKRQKHLPVVLDIDDWEIFMRYPHSKYMLKNMAYSLPRLRQPDCYAYTWALDKLTGRADAVTVVSTFFQRRYGGTILPQGVDVDSFDPARFDREALRREWGLSDFKVLTFIGDAYPHKGLSEVVAALEQAADPAVRLVIAGAGGNPAYVAELRRHPRVIYLGAQPYEKVPMFLSMADLVVLPQRLGPYSAGQLPNKLFEALAMGKPVISTRVSDIPQVLDGCGLVVEPGDVRGIAHAIDTLTADDALRYRLGVAARAKALNEYTWTRMADILGEIFARWETPAAGRASEQRTREHARIR
jgi:glycosyltransferase involved in cell wall biosynthesis